MLDLLPRIEIAITVNGYTLYTKEVLRWAFNMPVDSFRQISKQNNRKRKSFTHLYIYIYVVWEFSFDFYPLVLYSSYSMSCSFYSSTLSLVFSLSFSISLFVSSQAIWKKNTHTHNRVDPCLVHTIGCASPAKLYQLWVTVICFVICISFGFNLSTSTTTTTTHTTNIHIFEWICFQQFIFSAVIFCALWVFLFGFVCCDYISVFGGRGLDTDCDLNWNKQIKGIENNTTITSNENKSEICATHFSIWY